MLGNHPDNNQMEDLFIDRLYESVKNIIKFDFIPTLLNIFVCRKHWHVGTGVDNEPEWDTFKLFEKYNSIDFLKIEQEVDELLKGI